MAAGLVAPTHAQSDASVTLDAEYMVDIVTVADGADKGTRHVDLLSVTGELDLDAVAGWNGARVVAQVIAGTGDEPNDLAGTLQGINNNAVSDNRIKLYQLYLAQEFADAPVMLRAGFIDLNEDFYANDAAGLLIAPAFGIGSELAATGPNGPAIFPSTSLTATMRVETSASMMHVSDSVKDAAKNTSDVQIAVKQAHDEVNSMILKASQRSGAAQLGQHLLKTEENEHVEVHEGEVFALSRLIGVKAKDVTARLGKADALRSVEETKAHIANAIAPRLDGFLKEAKRMARDALKPLAEKKKELQKAHAEERQRMAMPLAHFGFDPVLYVSSFEAP